MKKLSDILGKTISKYNLTGNAFALMVIGRMRKYLSDQFGGASVQYMEVKRYFRSTIYIECKSSVWAQEVQLLKHELITNLKKDFPDKHIDIKISH